MTQYANIHEGWLAEFRARTGNQCMTGSSDLRSRIQLAYFQEDADLISRLVSETVPQSGYDGDFNLIHLAVLTRKSHILRLTVQLIGTSWELLCKQTNRSGQTPRDLAVELGPESLVIELDELLGEGLGAKKVKQKSEAKVDEKRLQMPIEDELREEQLDGFGRKSQQKLNTNIRGKPYWNG